MKTRKKKAGSALLLVVGLLTILGMLGGTFLLVASMHRRVTASLAARAPLHDMPIGILNQIAAKLGRDLYIAEFPNPAHGHAPYLAATGQDDVGKYSDSVSTDPILDTRDTAVKKDKLWTVLFKELDTNDNGVIDSADYGGADPPGWIDNDSDSVPDWYTPVDTDGDATNDASLYPTGVVNADGEEIFAAVRVVDLASLMDANVATGKTAAVTPITPVKVGLLELLGASRYNALHLERCSQTTKTPAQFSLGSAEILASAVSPFRPFSIEDELFLRWLKPGAATDAGRLYDALTDFGQRGLLTVSSRSRSLLRKPAFFETQTYTTRLQLTALGALDNDEKRNWLRTELYRVLGLVEDEEGEGEAVIVDTGAATVNGDWLTGAVYRPNYYGADYAHDKNTDKGTKTMVFAPNITAAGNCEVFMWWPVWTGANTNTQVDIVHADGTATVTVNQSANGGQWNSLGSYNFNSGTAGTITIRPIVGDTAHVLADAVKVVMPYSGGPPTTPEPPDPFVIEQLEEGQDGGWVWSSSRADRHGADYAHDNGMGKGEWTFTFNATMPMPGEYEVYMWWPANVGVWAAGIPVDIVHMDGTTTVTVDQSVGGGAWSKLGAVSYNFAKGAGSKVVIRTDGTDGFKVVADAVRFVCITAPTTADPKTVDHWLANLWAYTSQYNPIKKFKVGDAYGIVPQLVIAEVYAYSYKDDPATTTVDESGWAYAIELYNPTSATVDAGDYSLICGGSLSWDFPAGTTVASDSRIVIYDFGGDIGGATADEADFGFPAGHRATGILDFSTGSGGGAVTIVRDVGGDEIPVDAVTTSDLSALGYTVINKLTNDGGAQEIIGVGQRDDNFSRGRSLVALMKILTTPTITGHSLGSANSLAANEAQLTGVYEGFFIRTKPATWGDGDTEGLGKLITRYIKGPSIATDGDLPHSLLTHMGSNNRGRINYNAITPTWPAGYPELGWPQLLGELLELVPPHTTASASSVIYGRININTASTNVLRKLPLPNDAAFTDFEIADAITNGRPYHTPSQVGKVLADYADGELTNKTAVNYLTRRNSIYAAIADLITVNSDVFAVYIRTQIGNDANASASYHVAVIDRSNCVDNDDTPQILMYAEIKQ